LPPFDNDVLAKHETRVESTALTVKYFHTSEVAIVNEVDE